MPEIDFDTRLDHIRRFYDLLGDLEARLGGKRTFATAHGRMDWPRRGWGDRLLNAADLEQYGGHVSVDGPGHAVGLPGGGRLADEDRLGAAFRVRQWWQILKADKLGYFIAWVIVAGPGAVLYTGSMLLYSTMILFVLVPFLVAPTGFYVALVGAVLFGGSYRESAAALAGGAGLNRGCASGTDRQRPVGRSSDGCCAELPVPGNLGR